MLLVQLLLLLLKPMEDFDRLLKHWCLNVLDISCICIEKLAVLHKVLLECSRRRHVDLGKGDVRVVKWISLGEVGHMHWIELDFFACSVEIDWLCLFGRGVERRASSGARLANGVLMEVAWSMKRGTRSQMRKIQLRRFTL